MDTKDGDRLGLTLTRSKTLENVVDLELKLILRGRERDNTLWLAVVLELEAALAMVYDLKLRHRCVLVIEEEDMMAMGFPITSALKEIGHS
jgi:hypothetical protein